MIAATPTTPGEQAAADARYTTYQSCKLLFEQQTADLFTNADYLLLPCAPVSKLIAHEDQSETRTRILRYTAPISLAGLPAVTLPGVHGGLQLAGPPNSDATLLALSAHLGTLIAPSAPSK
jgi:Asp-tRNA(Asn)/Glu-tRNA(Gln) amidotransferase A subunit family amidase